MGYQHFKADVVAAAAADLGVLVSRVKRGESDEELVFTYTHHDLPSPIEVHALVKGLTKYPKGHRYMIFANNDVVPIPIQTALRMPPASTVGMSVLDVIRYITRIITAELETATGADEELDALGLGDDDLVSDAGDSDISEYEVALHDFEDEDHALPPPRLDNRLPSILKKLSRTAHKNLKRDLTAAIRVGIRPKLLHDTEVHLHSIFALPFKVAQLGVPDNTLEAWDIEPNDFIVLLMQLNDGYPSLQDFLASENGSEQVNFRLGKCKNSEPSLSSARLAFSRSHWQDVDKGSTQRDEPSEAGTSGQGTTSDTFVVSYLFGPINEILGEYLPRLIRLRRTQKLSWDEAQERVCQDERRQDKTTPEEHKLQSSQDPDPRADPIISHSVSSALQADFVLEDEKDFSLPLVAVQFALRRLARCAEFCMVCHRKIKGGYEAVKPSVCEDHLCLFKFMNLGLGRAAEHEIVKQPYVVDLLISFFGAAINNKSRTTIPRGLGIKTFDEHKGIAAWADFSKGEVRFDKSAESPHSEFSKGASFVIASGPSSDRSRKQGEADQPGIHRHICRIKTAHSNGFEYSIVGRYVAPVLPGGSTTAAIQPGPLPLGGLGIPATGPLPSSLFPSAHSFPVVSEVPDYAPPAIEAKDKGPQRVKLWLLNIDIDDLDVHKDESRRKAALLACLNCIPCVLDMRAFLESNPRNRLSQWNQMDQSASLLLNWILASNRSYIVQDGLVPKATAKPAGGPLASQRKINGLGSEWMQFRFQQGCPEKEHRFTTAVEAAKLARHDYRALFAWHGSAFANWHSIVRQGLDFDQITNGRSQGNGVYLSPDMQVSQGYARRFGSTRDWEQSVIFPTQALSICELVNNTPRFVCTNPCFVVDQKDWIQCRYLLVKVTPDTNARKEPLPSPVRSGSKDHIAQDTTWPLRNGPARLKLPRIAAKDEAPRKQSSPRRVTNEEAISKALVSCGISDEVDASPLGRGKRRREASASPTGRPRKKVNEGAKKLNSNVVPDHVALGRMAFAPGSVERSSLPILPEPAWAASSLAALKNLGRNVKELHATQNSTPLAQLGWYIDFDKMDNLFQWIVELHSFPESLPLAKDMKQAKLQSIVLEVRFGSTYPNAPPFVRVIRPTFLPFRQGGGGHVTEGGAICSELLTNSGWLPILSLDQVFVTVWHGLSDTQRPARLAENARTSSYSIHEAVNAYERAARTHGWQIPPGFRNMVTM